MRKYQKTIAVFGLTALSCACLMNGCKKKPEKIDLGSTHTTAAETMASETTTTAETVSKTTTAVTLDAAVENAANSNGSSSTGNGQAASNVKNLSTAMNTYTSGKISIQYPSVTNLEDSQKAAAIDTLLKDNALSIIKAYGVREDSDTLTVVCKVLSADRNRITVVYTGSFTAQTAAYPVNVFYSNTIDVNKAANMGFSHFVDPYTMAGYVLSSDCVFPEADASLTAELMKVKNEQSLDYYTNLFTHADFPVNGKFPSTFSYEHEGNIYFSIPVAHALGDYALVMYTPDTK